MHPKTWWDFLWMTYAVGTHPLPSHEMNHDETAWQRTNVVLLTSCLWATELFSLQWLKIVHLLTLYYIRCVRHSLEKYGISLLPVTVFLHLCCNEIAMEDKFTHLLRFTEMALPSVNSLVPLTSYLSLNEITMQNKHSITYCLLAGMWMRLTASALLLTNCFSCSHLANKWWYNSHTFCWPSDKMKLVWSRSVVIAHIL